MLIEQAVFTSARTDRGRGYHLVATSPGIRPEDARQLTAWAPAHGSLCSSGANAESVNFHGLSSGALCVSRSAAAGAEYSGRSGPRIYTQFFVVSADDLNRFANNPLALLHAARVHGALKFFDPVPPMLPAFELPGRTATVDEGLLAEMAERFDPRHIAWLVEKSLRADALVLVGAAHPTAFLAGLLNLLPVECRQEISFATGLVYSPRRPFRISIVELDDIEERRLARQPGLTLWNLADSPPADFVPTGWAAYLEEAIRADRLTTVAAELHRARPGLRLSDLAWLADQLRGRLRTAVAAAMNSAAMNSAAMNSAAVNSAAKSFTPGDPPAPHIPRLTAARPDAAAETGDESLADRLSQADLFREPHARHDGPSRPCLSGLNPQPAGPARPVPIVGPSSLLGVRSLEVLEKLERLDDLVFDTINGRRPALDDLAHLWPQVMSELPRELWAESREQYLRYALALWDSVADGGVRDPQWAVAALDVLSVLFDAAA